MSAVSVTTAGYELVDEDGNFLTWCEHVEDALASMKELSADRIIRLRDRALIAEASKYRKRPR